MKKIFLTALLVAMVSASTTFAAVIDSDFGTTGNQTFLYHAGQHAEATATFQRDFEARQGGILVKIAKNFKSTITLMRGETTAKATHLMKLMALGIKQGSKVKIVAEGPDAQEAVETIREFIEAGCPTPGD